MALAALASGLGIEPGTSDAFFAVFSVPLAFLASAVAVIAIGFLISPRRRK